MYDSSYASQDIREEELARLHDIALETPNYKEEVKAYHKYKRELKTNGRVNKDPLRVKHKYSGVPTRVTHADNLFGKQGLYFLFREGILVYIGQSDCIMYRIGQHYRDSSKVFDSYSYKEIYDEHKRKNQEARLIAKYQPEYNVQHNGSKRIPKNQRKTPYKRRRKSAHYKQIQNVFK